MSSVYDEGVASARKKLKVTAMPIVSCKRMMEKLDDLLLIGSEKLFECFTNEELATMVLGEMSKNPPLDQVLIFARALVGPAGRMRDCR